MVLETNEAAVFFQHSPRITQELAIFEPFLFFHLLHIKKIQITVEAAVIFQHSPRITKKIDISNTILNKPETVFA